MKKSTFMCLGFIFSYSIAQALTCTIEIKNLTIGNLTPEANSWNISKTEVPVGDTIVFTKNNCTASDTFSLYFKSEIPIPSNIKITVLNATDEGINFNSKSTKDYLIFENKKTCAGPHCTLEIGSRKNYPLINNTDCINIIDEIQSSNTVIKTLAIPLYVFKENETGQPIYDNLIIQPKTEGLVPLFISKYITNILSLSLGKTENPEGTTFISQTSWEDEPLYIIQEERIFWNIITKQKQIDYGIKEAYGSLLAQCKALP